MEKPVSLRLERKNPIEYGTYPEGFLPPGGHITYPPEECLYRKKVFKVDGIPVLDFGICQSICSKAKKCDRRKSWMKNKYGEYANLLFKWQKLHPGR